jgi:hypothetical protein
MARKPTTLAHHEVLHLAKHPALGLPLQRLLVNDVAGFQAAWQEASPVEQNEVRSFLQEPSTPPPKTPKFTADPGLHRLCRACWHGMVEAVLGAGAVSVNQTNPFEQTALACAGSAATVNVLLDAGLDTDARDNCQRLAPHAWFDEGPQAAEVVRQLRAWWNHPRTQHLDHAAWAKSILTERWSSLPSTIVDVLLSRGKLPAQGSLLVDGRSPLGWAWHQQQKKDKIKTPRRLFGFVGTPPMAAQALARTAPDDRIEGLSSRFVALLDLASWHPWNEVARQFHEQSPESQRPIAEQWQLLHQWLDTHPSETREKDRAMLTWWACVTGSYEDSWFTARPPSNPDLVSFLSTPDPYDPQRLPPLAEAWHGWEQVSLTSYAFSIETEMERWSLEQWRAVPSPELWLGGCGAPCLGQADIPRRCPLATQLGTFGVLGRVASSSVATPCPACLGRPDMGG